MRVIADSGSPWLPVQRMSCSLGRQLGEVLRAQDHLVGNVHVAEVARDVRGSCASSGRRTRPCGRTRCRRRSACCIRCTFDANDEMRIRPVPRREDLAERLADDALRLREARPARRSSSRRAGGRRRGCRARRACRRRCAGRRRACGRACSRRCGRRARRASRARSPTASGIECAMRTNSIAERAEVERLVAGRRPRAARLRAARPCSSSFDLTSPSVSLVATTDRNVHLAHEIRQRADVVLVAVREHDAADHRRALDEIARSPGGSRSTPRCSSRGNARPASTITIEPSASNTVMFFPTSPRPPRGMMRQIPTRGV